MQISIKIQGSKEMIDRFNRLGDKVKNFGPEFKELGEYLTQYYSGEAFLSNGSVFRSRWAPLSPAYQKVKSKKYPGRQPMEATGKMRNNFKSDASAKQLVIRNESDQFKYHQSSAPRFKLPRRIMIGYNNTIKDKTKDLISKGLERILHG